MVAAPQAASTAAIGAAAQAAQAQTEKRTLWSPRSGLTDTFEDWKHETLLRIAKIGFNTFEDGSYSRGSHHPKTDPQWRKPQQLGQ